MCLGYNPESQAVEFPAQPVRIADSRLRSLFLLSLFTGFGWLTLSNSHVSTVFPLVIIGVFLCYSIFVQVKKEQLRKLTNRKLSLDSQGLTIKGVSIASVGFVPWFEITGIGVYPEPGGTKLAVFVQDPGAVVGRLSGYTRWIAKKNLVYAGTPVVIQPADVGTTCQHLEDTINLFRQQYPR